jgi:hypothetical protein
VTPAISEIIPAEKAGVVSVVSEWLWVEPLVRIELTTARLRIECSTAELQWRGNCYALARIRTATPFGTTPSR